MSYLDTIPFIHGIEHSGDLQAELLLSSVQGCVDNFVSGRADLALIPSSALPSLAEAQPVTDYCLSAAGPSRLAVVASFDRPALLHTLFYDPQRAPASMLLARYLAARLWKSAPEWRPIDLSVLPHLEAGQGVLLTDDDALRHSGEFEHQADLSQLWYKATRLPFVFAIWVAREGTPPATADALQRALTYGIEHTWEAICSYGYQADARLYEYLTLHLDYLFDHQKQTALRKFWNVGLKVAPRVNPG